MAVAQQFPPPRRRWSPVVVIAIVAVVFTALLGGGLLITKKLLGGGTGDDDSGAPGDGQLRATFPTKPEVGWRLDADDVLAGAKFVRPDPDSNPYLQPGFIDLGSTLITQVVPQASGSSRELVAIDSETGEIRWRTRFDAEGTQPGANCATATVDNLLPCVVGGDSMQYFDITSGAVRQTRSAPAGAYDIAVHGADIYTRGYANRQTVMTRGTVDDPTAGWHATYPVESQCPSTDSTGRFDVTDAVVLSGSVAHVTVASAADGHQLIDGVLKRVVNYPGQGVAGQLCTGESSYQSVVIDLDGHRLRDETDGPAAARPWLVAPSTTVPYIAGDSAYRFETQQRLWTATEMPTGTGLHTIVGDVVLGDASPVTGLPAGMGRGLAGYDLGTGEHLWTSGDVDGVNRGILSDGRRVIVGAGNGTVAIDLATGEQDWQLPDIEIWRLQGAGDGFAFADPDHIDYYPPTGGPSVAPGRRTAKRDDDGGLITKCGKVPEMRPVEYRAENGALVVTMQVKASCPGGDIVSTDRLRVRISDGTGPIADGVFDFSDEPLVLGGSDSDPTTIDLTFGSGEIWRLPNTLGEHSGGSATTAKASGDELVDCDDEGTSTGPTSTDSAPGKLGSATAAGDDNGCGSDAEALDALRVQVDTDRPVVQRDLADHWVAQLSSKQPGLVAPDVDGRMVTWTPCEILRQHLRLRLQYPEVRLVWSDEWRTFDLQGWWVTIAGVTFDNPDAANEWCDQRAIPIDQCFAKLVSNSRGSEGTTEYRQ